MSGTHNDEGPKEDHLYRPPKGPVKGNKTLKILEAIMADMAKAYLGDAVYAEFMGGRITLTTEDGVSILNIIILEPEVWGALTDYVAKVKALND